MADERMSVGKYLNQEKPELYPSAHANELQNEYRDILMDEFKESELKEAAKGRTIEDFVNALKMMKLEQTPEFKGLYEIIQVVKAHPERLFTPDQSKKIKGYIDQQLAIGTSGETLTVNGGMALTRAGNVLSQFSLLQKQQLLKLYFQEAKDSNDPTLAKKSARMAEAFIYSGALGKITVLKIAKEYGREAEFAAIKAPSEQASNFSEFALKKMRKDMGNAIRTSGPITKNEKMAGLAAMYVGGVTGLANVILYGMDSYANGGPGDSRYLFFALLGLGGALVGTEVATKDGERRGLIGKYLEYKATEDERAKEASKDIIAEANLAMERDRASADFYGHETTIRTLRSIVEEEMKLTYKPSEAKNKLVAKVSKAGDRTMIDRFKEKLDPEKYPQHQALLIYLNKRAKDPRLNYELLKMGMAYSITKTKTTEDVIKNFGHNKALYI